MEGPDTTTSDERMTNRRFFTRVVNGFAATFPLMIATTCAMPTNDQGQHDQEQEHVIAAGDVVGISTDSLSIKLSPKFIGEWVKDPLREGDVIVYPGGVLRVQVVDVYRALVPKEPVVFLRNGSVLNEQGELSLYVGHLGPNNALIDEAKRLIASIGPPPK